MDPRDEVVASGACALDLVSRDDGWHVVSAFTVAPRARVVVIGIEVDMGNRTWVEPVIDELGRSPVNLDVEDTIACKVDVHLVDTQ